MAWARKRRVVAASCGLGLTFAVYGVLLWSVDFVVPAPLDAEKIALYSFAGLLGALAGFLARPFTILLGMEERPSLGFALPVVFLGGCGLFALAVLSASAVALLASGLFVGFSVACLFVFWFKRLSALSNKEIRGVFVAALAIGGLFGVVLLAIPRFAVLPVTCAGAGTPLAALTFAALVERLRKPEQPVAGVFRALSAGGMRDGYQQAFKGLLSSLVCASALLVVLPALNSVALQDSLPWEQRVANACLAQLLVSIVLAVTFKLLRRSPSTESIYLVVAPFLVVAMFAVPFAGVDFSRCFLLLGSCLFFAITVTLMLDCLSMARKTRTDVAVLYGLCAAVTFLVRFAANWIMRTVSQSGVSQEMQMVAMALFVVYLLGFAYVVMQNRRRAQERLELAESVQSEAMLGKLPWSWRQGSREMECCQAIKEAAGLSEREYEVFQRLLRGKNVPAIAEELFISQNTVRSHVKRIYRLLDVHSRAELITFFEQAVDEEG